MAVKNNLFLLVMAILVAVGCNNAGRKDSEALRTCLEYPTWSTGCFIVPVVLTCNSVPDTMGTCCIVAANAGYFMDRYMNQLDRILDEQIQNHNEALEEDERRK